MKKNGIPADSMITRKLFYNVQYIAYIIINQVIVFLNITSYLLKFLLVILCYSTINNGNSRTVL